MRENLRATVDDASLQQPMKSMPKAIPFRLLSAGARHRSRKIDGKLHEFVPFFAYCILVQPKIAAASLLAACAACTSFRADLSLLIPNCFHGENRVSEHGGVIHDKGCCLNGNLQVNNTSAATGNTAEVYEGELVSFWLDYGPKENVEVVGAIHDNARYFDG